MKEPVGNVRFYYGTLPSSDETDCSRKPRKRSKQHEVRHVSSACPAPVHSAHSFRLMTHCATPCHHSPKNNQSLPCGRPSTEQTTPRLVRGRRGIAGHRANRCTKYSQGPRPFQKRFGCNRFAWPAGFDRDPTAGASAQDGLQSKAWVPNAGPGAPSLAGAFRGSKPPLAAYRNAFATADQREQKSPYGLSNSALAILRHGDDSSRNPRRPARVSVMFWAIFRPARCYSTVRRWLRTPQRSR